MLSGISLPHILLLLLIVIMVFGTSKLKNLGKDLGGDSKTPDTHGALLAGFVSVG